MDHQECAADAAHDGRAAASGDAGEAGVVDAGHGCTAEHEGRTGSSGTGPLHAAVQGRPGHRQGGTRTRRCPGHLEGPPVGSGESRHLVDEGETGQLRRLRTLVVRADPEEPEDEDPDEGEPDQQ